MTNDGIYRVIITEYHRVKIRSSGQMAKSQVQIWLASIFDSFNASSSNSDWYFNIPDTGDFVAIK